MSDSPLSASHFLLRASAVGKRNIKLVVQLGAAKTRHSDLDKFDNWIITIQMRYWCAKKLNYGLILQKSIFLG